MTTQLDCSLGLKKESAYGTYAAPDQFLEFISESFDAGVTFTQGEGMRPGARVARAGRRRITKIEPSGSIEFEAPTSGLGAILQAVFGQVTNTEVPTATGVFQQVHTPATTDFLDSFTIQKGIPPLGGGATHPITFLGAMCNSIELSAAAGELLKVNTEWTAKDVITDQAYEAPSYPTALDLFSFVDGSLFIGNTLTDATATALASASGSAAANIRDFSVKYENGLDGEGFNLGGNGRRTRKQAVGTAVVSGNLTAEYDTAMLRDAYLANEGLSMLLNFAHPTEIATGLYSVLQVLVPMVFLDGELPKSNGGDVITQSIPFVGLDTLSGAPIKVVYRTLDTAV